jgi:hypothetical protein
VQQSTVAAALDPSALSMGANAETLSIVRSGTLHVDLPPEQALMLFTAPGEKLWVDEWDPVILSGDGLEKGSVFVTEAHEKTIWLVIEFDPEALHARYARVAPESRAGTVDVHLAADEGGGSLVTVTYELTGLTAKGNRMLEAMDDAAYARMMRDWEAAIRDADL